MRIERLERVRPFTTKDGSEIRELAGMPTGNSVNQSLAEATVPPGGETEEHYHRASEEIYLFTHGSGRMKLGDEEAEVARRRRRGDPARHAAQALEHGRRAAEAALLLRARRTRTTTRSIARSDAGTTLSEVLDPRLDNRPAGASTATSSRRSATRRWSS